MQVEEDVPRELELAQALSEQGYNDVLILRADTAERVLTGKKRELLDVIENGRIESVRGLARSVDRDPGRVQKDLTVLYEADIIDFEEDGNRKIPVLRHDIVVVEPVIDRTAS